MIQQFYSWAHVPKTLFHWSLVACVRIPIAPSFGGGGELEAVWVTITREVCGAVNGCSLWMTVQWLETEAGCARISAGGF